MRVDNILVTKNDDASHLQNLLVQHLHRAGDTKCALEERSPMEMGKKSKPGFGGGQKVPSLGPVVG